MRRLPIQIPTLLAMLTCAASVPSRAAELTHGIAIGDVTASSALVWGRCSEQGALSVSAAVEEDPAAPVLESWSSRASVAPSHDLAAQVLLDGLYPATRYRVEVSCIDPRERVSPPRAATFTTAAAADEVQQVQFIVSGDLGGQTYCRLAEGGYRIFGPMAGLRANFFIANGDMIYADNPCPERGGDGLRYVDGGFPGVGDPSVQWTDREQLEQVYRGHWAYNRADQTFQDFLRSTPLYVQWDDHEVINDFGGPWPFYLPMPQRPGYEQLVAVGRQSLFDWHPITEHPEEAQRIYRSFRWGRDLELFLIDARSYRSRNDLVDEPNAAEDGKTLLGREQLQWLLEGLRASDATWKVVSSDVPLSIPTGSGASAFGRDAFASGATPFGEAPDFAARTGFESELLWLLTELDRADVTNLVFVATDVHFPAQIRYEPDLDQDGDRLRFFELISGPLSAVRSPAPVTLDATLRPVYLYAEGDVFNFAYVRLVGGGPETLPRLLADVRDETGRVRPGSELVIEPETGDGGGE